MKEGNKSEEMWVYVVSCILLLSIVTGGAFLSLYVAHPASDTAGWYLKLGMALEAIPWLFWGATSLYRIISLRRAAASGAGPGRPLPPVKAAGGAAKEDAYAAPVDSPGGARRVRFGANVVLGGAQAAPTREKPPEENAFVAPAAQDGSSHNSHASERPLFDEV